MYRVLSISENVHLLLSRNDILAVAGFSVISPKQPEQAAALALQENVDAVVIGHSIEPSLRRAIIAEVRQVCPTCLIYFVYAAPDKDGEPRADISLDLTEGPEALVRSLQQLLPRVNPRAS